MPSGVSEVMKLFEDGIPADIMVSYINNSPLSFYLSADNLISLQKEVFRAGSDDDVQRNGWSRFPARPFPQHPHLRLTLASLSSG